MKNIISPFFALFIICNATHAQMPRERAGQNGDGPVEETFWAPHIVGMGTVEQTGGNNLNVTIMHSFGIATNRPVNNFFGLDSSPNVRLGIDYGITDYWSLGIGRTTSEKVVDLRTKLTLFRQTQSSSLPVSFSLKGSTGLKTLENGQPIGNDLNFFASAMIARKFGDHLSIQVAPMYAHFNTVDPAAGEVYELVALGFGAEYHLSRRYALSAEYYPVIGERNPDTSDAFALALNIETGGHVFQLFFASSSWHTEPYVLARNKDNFWAGDFRFGFNINRLFFLGEH